jgi:hypothetical protein
LLVLVYLRKSSLFLASDDSSLMACTFTFAEDNPAEGHEMCEAELQLAHEICEESGATDCSTTPGRFQPPVPPCPSTRNAGAAERSSPRYTLGGETTDQPQVRP